MMKQIDQALQACMAGVRGTGHLTANVEAKSRSGREWRGFTNDQQGNAAR